LSCRKIGDDLLILAGLELAGAAGSIADHPSYDASPLLRRPPDPIDSVQVMAAAAALIDKGPANFQVCIRPRPFTRYLRTPDTRQSFRRRLPKYPSRAALASVPQLYASRAHLCGLRRRDPD